MESKKFETGRHLNTFSAAEAQSAFEGLLENAQTRNTVHGARCCCRRLRRADGTDGASVCVWQAQRILKMCPNESWLMKYRNFESLRKREREIASLRSEGRHGEADKVRLFSHPHRPSTRTAPPPLPFAM